MRKIKNLRLILFYLIALVLLMSYLLPSTIPAYAQESANVSITVVPKTSDFQFVFSSTDGLTNVNQDTELSYQITYGANSSAAFPTDTVLEVDFSDDLAPDSSHVLDYVPGSASNAYGGAVPVVDLENRTITWTIPNLPAGVTNQTVVFKLKTNSNYTGGSIVGFATKASMSNQYVTMPDQTINQSYQFSPVATPTPTPTPGLNSASTPTAPTTPILTVKPSRIPPTNPLKIIGVGFASITSSGATISIETSQPSISTITYGITPISLLRKSQSGKYTLQSNIALQNLQNGTKYYFRVMSADKNGNAAQSEIFTFTTASAGSEPLIIGEGAVSIESMGIKVFSKIIDKNSQPGFVLLTENADFILSFTPKRPPSYKAFDVIIKKNNSTEKKVNLLKTNLLFFVSSLRTSTVGKYEIFLKATDANGNIAEQKIADLKVVKYLSVFEKGSNKPIGDAHVFLYVYNSQKGKFEPIAVGRFGDLRNPVVTDKTGTARLILPPGQYRADVRAMFYDNISQKFILGQSDTEIFPRIYLNKNPLNIIGIVENIWDWMRNISLSMQSLASSTTAFNVIAIGVTGAFSLISFILFLLKTHLGFRKVPVFFLFGLHMVLKKHRDKFLFGTVVDKEKNPLSKARIDLIDKKTGELITHTTSNKLGRFHFHNIEKADIKMRIAKDGYKEDEISLGEQNDLSIMLRPADGKGGIRVPGVRLMEHIGGSMFETFLIATIILELFFLANFGLMRTLPFLVLSLFNILLWTFFLLEKKS